MIEVDLDPGRDSSLIEGPNSPEEELRLDAATRSPDLAARPNKDLVSDPAKIQRLDPWDSKASGSIQARTRAAPLIGA